MRHAPAFECPEPDPFRTQSPATWYLPALVLAVVNPIVEPISPRGTNDFTMATVNALVCVAFGWLVL